MVGAFGAHGSVYLRSSAFICGWLKSMSHAARGTSRDSSLTPVLPNLLPLCRRALEAAEGYVQAARGAVGALVAPGGAIDASALDREQVAAHGFAWLATYATALKQILRWAERLDAAGRLDELESLIAQAAFGEYLAQMLGGMAMGQSEIVRPT